MKSLILAFSMYSAIPMPHTDCEEGDGRNVFCFFPLVGLVTGMAELASYYVLSRLGTGEFMRGAILCSLPLLINGGIHMDGFLDTMDAVSSHSSRERKLEILKDPHIGAFAMIYGGIYMMLSLAAWIGIGWQEMKLMAVFFIFERAASSLCAINFPASGIDSSLLFFKKREGARESLVLLAESLICLGLMVFIHLPGAMLAVAVTAIMAAVYHRLAMKHFGGIRGDTAGWFLQCCELAFLLSLILLGF